jgi:hypothetical protein
MGRKIALGIGRAVKTVLLFHSIPLFFLVSERLIVFLYHMEFARSYVHVRDSLSPALRGFGLKWEMRERDQCFEMEKQSEALRRADSVLTFL